MAAASTTLERTIQILGTGPSAFPSRLGNIAGTLSSTYPKVIANIIQVSTQAAVTINFQGMTIARIMYLATDGKLKIRQNGNNPVALGSTSSMASAMIAHWEGSTTSLVVSNTSTTHIANLEYLLAGRV